MQHFLLDSRMIAIATSLTGALNVKAASLINKFGKYSHNFLTFLSTWNLVDESRSRMLTVSWPRIESLPSCTPILSVSKTTPWLNRVLMISKVVGNYKFHAKTSSTNFSISSNSSKENGHCICLHTSETIGYLISQYLALMNNDKLAINVQICSETTPLQLAKLFLKLSIIPSIWRNLS